MKRILILTVLSACAVDVGETQQATRCQTCENDDWDPTNGGTSISPTSPEAAPVVSETINRYGAFPGLYLDVYRNGTNRLNGTMGTTACIHDAGWSTGFCCTAWDDGQFDCSAW